MPLIPVTARQHMGGVEFVSFHMEAGHRFYSNDSGEAANIFGLHTVLRTNQESTSRHWEWVVFSCEMFHSYYPGSIKFIMRDSAQSRALRERFLTPGIDWGM